jgi:aromatic-amino-acid transaminase
MAYMMAASHSQGKFATDKIFGANALAVKAVAQFGKENVTNATIGALLDDNEQLVCLPSVEKEFRKLPITEIINYAPIAGLPDYLDAAINHVFGDSRPDAFARAVATSGGSGVLHHAIWNYTEMKDTVLTSDWYWGPYKVLCEEVLRKLDTFTLFDEKLKFNMASFEAKISELLAKQNNLLVILNTPAHNPTGYSITDSEWDGIIQLLKNAAKNPDKRITVVLDIAYLDFSGERNSCRKFFAKLSKMPDNLLFIAGFSMSKSFTMYGQRVGAMIGITSNTDVAKEFEDINQYSNRATWSNINRGCMRLMATICADKALYSQVEKERDGYYQLIKQRGDIFVQEAAAANLSMLPYDAGYFLSVPAGNPDAVCEKLNAQNVFAVALAKGIRVAVCAVPTSKIKGMAGKIKAAMDSAGK